ncbi:MAG: aldo/keto reductase [Chloroflexi bacterium AL-W]|nr:aldo/keto reductase [Chloroflexi bacterium AL-W]
MQYTRLGRTGLKVSRLCLGTMTFGWSADETTSHAIMDAAFDAGINFFDTADIYSRWAEGNPGGVSEQIIGTWLKTKPRHQVIVATKARGRMWEGVTGEGLSRHHIMQAVEDSLRRLDTDYIDLYQTHSPDDETPLDETLRALDDLVRSGKVRYVGASNYPAWLMMKSLWVSDLHNIARYETIQPRYSLLSRTDYENQLVDVCRDQQIGVIPYSPLAAGFLTGKYTRDNKKADTTRADSGIVAKLINDEGAYKVLDAVREYAEGYSVPMAHVALAWMMAKETIHSPIIGARTVSQLQEVIGATELRLTPAEVQRLDDLSEGY